MVYINYDFENFNSEKNNPYCNKVDCLEQYYNRKLDKKSQIEKYKVISIDSDREFISIEPAIIYDNILDKFFFVKNVPLHLLKFFSELRNNGEIEALAVRLVNELGYSGRMDCEYIAES